MQTIAILKGKFFVAGRGDSQGEMFDSTGTRQLSGKRFFKKISGGLFEGGDIAQTDD